MSKYLLLLYAGGVDAAEQAEREAEMPKWVQYTQDLIEAGVFQGSDRLYPAESATTVRVRNDETELVDGPFAITKEFLGGYYLLDCPDLNNALKWAARAPIARYGSVEVRPVIDLGAAFASDPAAARA
jgi:hypothetical protein